MSLVFELSLTGNGLAIVDFGHPKRGRSADFYELDEWRHRIHNL